MITRKKEFHLILDNIRSVHNVGSIFRTAETAGVGRIYCVGTTPIPLDRFGNKRKDFTKVSLGSEEMLPWEYAESAIKLIKKLKKEGFQIISLEQNERSQNYRKIKIGEKTALVLGNEVDGVHPEILENSDSIAEIPLLGKKESLNVSVAAGIAIFHFLNI